MLCTSPIGTCVKQCNYDNYALGICMSCITTSRTIGHCIIIIRIYLCMVWWVCYATTRRVRIRCTAQRLTEATTKQIREIAKNLSTRYEQLPVSWIPVYPANWRRRHRCRPFFGRTYCHNIFDNRPCIWGWGTNVGIITTCANSWDSSHQPKQKCTA